MIKLIPPHFKVKKKDLSRLSFESKNFSLMGLSKRPLHFLIVFLLLFVIPFCQVFAQVETVPNGCYAFKVANNNKFLTNVNGKLKVQPNNGSLDQVFRLDGGHSSTKLVAQGGTNRGYINYNYSPSMAAGDAVELKNTFPPATSTNAEADAPLWQTILLSPGIYGIRTPVLPMNPPTGWAQFSFGSTLDWGNGSSNSNISDIYLVTQSDMNLHGSNKWVLEPRTCPADFCDYNIASLTSTDYNPAYGTYFTLTANCVGGGCVGLTYRWYPSDGLTSAGNTTAYQSGFPTSTSPTIFKVEAWKDGCPLDVKSGSVAVNMQPASSNFSQCLESESSNGNGSITSDPNASNGQTRGDENNNGQYVDYAITGVPAAGTYSVKLRYYASSAPIVNVQVNGGSGQTVNLPATSSWNIVWTEQTISVNLNAGSNTIRIQGIGGGSCRQDKICVSNGSGARFGIDVLTSQESGSKHELNISPNPNNGNFFASFYLEAGKKASLKVIDMNGRILQERGILGKGAHKEKVQIDGNTVGSFLVQVLKEDGQQVKKVMIAR